MINDLIEKRKKTLAESEQHKNLRNELNSAASKSARERNTLNNQTREFVDEAQKNKDLRDKYNTEVIELKVQRNDLNDQANTLFEDIEVYKKESSSLIKYYEEKEKLFRLSADEDAQVVLDKIIQLVKMHDDSLKV